jgi:hypothetical protein
VLQFYKRPQIPGEDEEKTSPLKKIEKPSCKDLQKKLEELNHHLRKDDKSSEQPKTVNPSDSINEIFDQSLIKTQDQKSPP